MKKEKFKNIKNSCGGQGCDIQPYILPYILKEDFKNKKQEIKKGVA